MIRVLSWLVRPSSFGEALRGPWRPRRWRSSQATLYTEEIPTPGPNSLEGKAGRRKRQPKSLSGMWEESQGQMDGMVAWNRDGTVVLDPAAETTTTTSPAATAAPSATTSRKPVRLATMARCRPLDELLAMVGALVDVGKIGVAEAVVAEIRRVKHEAWSRLRDPALPNMFLNNYLLLQQSPDEAKAEPWKVCLFSRENFVPNALSYAILFEHLLRKGATAECLSLFEQMLAGGILLEEVISLELLQAKHRARLLELLQISPADRGQEDFLVKIDDLFIGKDPSSPNDNGQEVAKGAGQLPEVRPVPSKSQGIEYLRSSLQSLSDLKGVDPYFLQEQLERDCYTATMMRLRAEIDNYHKATDSQMYTPTMKRLLADWHLEFTSHLDHVLNNLATHTADATATRLDQAPKNAALMFSALLSTLEPERISLICLQEMTRVSAITPNVRGMVVARLAQNIGSAIEREVFAAQISRQTFLRHTKLNPRRLSKIFSNRNLFEVTMREQYAALAKNMDAIQDGWIPRWSTKLRAEVGAYVLTLAIDLLKITDEAGVKSPAFTHLLVRTGPEKYVGTVRMHKELLKMAVAQPAAVFVEPWAMPMLVPPRPWLTHCNGGYLTQRMSCVRFKGDPVHLTAIHEADRQGKLSKILLGLDVLGQTSWRVNEPVLRVVLELWNRGVNVSELASSEHLIAQISRQLNAALATGSMDANPDTSASTGTGSDTDIRPDEPPKYRPKESFASHEEYVNYVREAIRQRAANDRALSMNCETNYRLEIARQFAGIKFYLPHSIDFRGRAYPIPPHLSHVGSDLSRGLLAFAEGRPLGSAGLRWLKIQLANMAGFDKASLDERAAYADSNRENILDSADNPLTGKMWWRRADEPWQCLATCIELAQAWRSPCAEEFISHLPVQQDGSCNGLQHYAALGRDIDGATQVNLAPSDRPQDVYAAVAQLVSRRVKEDAAADPTSIATKLVGKINRKVIKQPVMTNVYGVTMYGARAQIEERLREFSIVGAEDYKAARIYLARLVFESLGAIFERAQEIQRWFTQTATEIARAVPASVAERLHTLSATLSRKEMERAEKADPSLRYPQTSVMWTTPLGFQVVQPYLTPNYVSLRTVLQMVKLRSSSAFDSVDISKQASAFPPNFVHSLDATHMFMTAIACHRAGLTFASVHDCFWTHAGTVDEMGRILREQFVQLHSQPILEKLRAEFMERYRGYKVPVTDAGKGAKGVAASWRDINIPPLPEKGEFDVSLVLQSRYFFN